MRNAVQQAGINQSLDDPVDGRRRLGRPSRDIRVCRAVPTGDGLAFVNEIRNHAKRLPLNRSNVGVVVRRRQRG